MATLSDLSLRHRDVWVVCILCTHYTRYTIVELLNRCGYSTPVERALRRFECGNCKTHSANFVYSQPSTDLGLIRRYKAR